MISRDYTGKSNAESSLGLDSTLCGYGFSDNKQAKSEEHWWEITNKFNSLWSKLQVKLNDIKELPKLASSNLSRWKKQPLLKTTRDGIARSKNHLSLANNIKSKIDEYLPEWIKASKKDTPSGLGDMGIFIIPALYLIIGAPALVAMSYVLYKGTELLTNVYIEKRILDGLEKKILTSDQAMSMFQREQKSSISDDLKSMKFGGTNTLLLIGLGALGWIFRNDILRKVKAINK